MRRSGNLEARAVIDEVFETASRTWRGIAELPASGLSLRPAYREFDALHRLADQVTVSSSLHLENHECQSGLVLQGQLKPSDCQAFGNSCTPEHPLGAPMVSSEGACAAYYRYRTSPNQGNVTNDVE